ncbi:MAG: hypothetical protein ABJB47_13690 [Actinomycetota bacterium]
MNSRTAEFDTAFLRDLREILLSTSVSESYDFTAKVTLTKDVPFLDAWQLLSLDFDPDLGKRRAVATLSAEGRTVEATIDACDFSELVRKKSRSRAWNSTRYRDLAVLVSVLIEEQNVT